MSVINVLLILNPKHSSYWEENSLHPRRNQDIKAGGQVYKHNEDQNLQNTKCGNF